MLRLWLAMALVIGLGACTHVWRPQVVPGCYLSAGDPQLDRERSYYALLLALSERRYEVLHTEPPRQVEVAYHSDYAPDQGFTWLIDVRHDATLAFQSVPAGARISRKQERWFELLGISLRRLTCRDLQWLRWEAQNKGLAPMATAVDAFAAGGGEQPVVEANSGQPVGVAASSAPAATSPAEVVAPAPPVWTPQRSLSAPAVDQRVEELRRERAQLSMRVPLALTITGGAIAVGALGVGIAAGIDLTEDCADDTYDGYCPIARGEKRAMIAGSLLAGAAAFLVTGFVLLGRRNRGLRRIRRELIELTVPVLVSGGFDQRGVNVSLRTTF